MKVRILPVAQERLLDIWDYTVEKWGEEQADGDVAGLVGHLHSIAAERMLWRPVKEHRMSAVYFVKYRHHYVFFREFSGFIGVISILHESMDIPNRLREDIEE
jgi:toxin ParE1/3/4